MGKAKKVLKLLDAKVSLDSRLGDPNLIRPDTWQENDKDYRLVIEMAGRGFAPIFVYYADYSEALTTKFLI